MKPMNDDKLPGWNPEASASFWINRASRLLLRRQEERLRPLGFGINQMSIVRALADGRSASQKDLAGWAQVEQPTMAEMLARMERDGLIKRKRNPKDGRGSLASLTRPARLRLPKARAALIEGEHEATAGFSTAERGLLLNLLQRVVSNLVEDNVEAGNRNVEDCEFGQQTPDASAPAHGPTTKDVDHD
jgi:DNA-binding MarR family transcriptional regulator